MKRSKSSSSSKKKRQNPSKESSKAKLTKTVSKSQERVEKKTEGKPPRKTRWEACASTATDETDKQVTTPKTEEQHLQPPLRIKDLLGDKEKLVEHLFSTIAGPALEALIPDYLKKTSVQELKKICLTQLKEMSDDSILQTISGKASPIEEVSNRDKPKAENSALQEKAAQLEAKNGSTTKLPSDRDDPSKSQTPTPCAHLSEDVLELCASSHEMESMMEEENPEPVSVEEAVEDRQSPESDAELLELEMRARAIRSLLKAKSQEITDPDVKK